LTLIADAGGGSTDEFVVLLFLIAVVGNGRGKGKGVVCVIGADRFCAVGKFGLVEAFGGTLGVRFIFCEFEEDIRGANVGLLLPIIDGMDGMDVLVL